MGDLRGRGYSKWTMTSRWPGETISNKDAYYTISQRIIQISTTASRASKASAIILFVVVNVDVANEKQFEKICTLTIYYLY